ncbi:glycosyltransferase [Brachyspira catarrhinii]|uniref:Glycosyltransferase n=1 Tax=Brachyspira catarrhinii TaxID=2528966 RepID=A0ABY2TSD7_9SPIR|nr:glycosyltransferase [Brachyspira catarrhinii]TKZ35792.1 glycosyltransferase [Brachyspira catarrhinii]
MNNDLISIIIPTYNGEKYISETIDSILNQTYKNWELIIIDDGSTDSTNNIVNKYIEKDSRISYYKNEKNMKQAYSLNRGFSLSKGNYLTWTADDNILLPNCIEILITFLLNNNCDLCYGNMLNFYTDKSLNHSNFNKFVIDTKKYGKLANLISCTVGGAFLYKRSIFNEIGEYTLDSDFHLVIDYDYWIRINKNHIILPIDTNDIIYHYRIHNNQLTSKYFSELLYQNILLIIKYLPDYELTIYNIEFVFNRIFELCSVIKDRYESNIDIDVYKKLINYIHHNMFQVLKDKIKLESEYISDYVLVKFCVKLNNLFSDKNIEKDLYDLLSISKFSCLQIGDRDLVGNKFNGHNLHIYLRELGIDANHIVNIKESDDENTYVYNTNVNNFTESLIKNNLFLSSDLLHLHLIHNTEFDIKYLPLITKLKPTVITLHDPYFLSGHCVYHFDCEKWKDHCYDCDYLDKPFIIENDDTAFKFEIKKQAIQNSNIVAIVASKWMEDKLKESPIWKNKKIYRIPFGIDQDKFKPKDIIEAKKELGIDKDSITLMFRADGYIYKGMDIIEEALLNINTNKTIVLITVGTSETAIKKLKNKYKILSYEWIKDDYLLAKLYQACDIFLMPSRQEAFGAMAAEAMSCEKMVLSISGTSLPEVINSPECGIACEEKEYTEKLQYLIDNLDEVKERGKKSLDFAIKNYNHMIYSYRILDIYKNMIEDYKLDENYKIILEQLKKYNNSNILTTNNNITTSNYKNNNFGIFIQNNDKYLTINIFGIKITIKKKAK